MIRLKTEEVRNIVTKLSKAAGYDNTIPITSLITLEAKNDVLELRATDKVHTMYGQLSISPEDFLASVDIKTLQQLLTKQTCEEITLQSSNRYLKIKGNGSYKLPNITDGNGKIAVVPDAKDLVSIKGVTIINSNTVKEIYQKLKFSTADKEFIVPEYHHFWFGAKTVLTTNTEKASLFSPSLFDKPIMVFHKTMQLLSLFDNDIQAKAGNKFMSFEDDIFTLITFFEETNHFDKVEAVFNQKFKYSIKIDSKALQDTLNRFSIFNQDRIEFVFTDELQIQSLSKEFVEKLETSEHINTSFVLDYNTIKEYSKTITNEQIVLCFNQNAQYVLIKDNNAAHIFAAIEITY